MKQEKLKQYGIRCLPYGIAFLLAFGIGLITYAVLGIAPFGEKTIICLDLWAQYFPMYAEMLQADSFADLLYSWNGGFGHNQWAQSAYYSNSIFVLLLQLIPMEGLISYIDWLAVVKIALSAVTCLGFLQYKTKSRSPLLVGGAVAYATSAYMLAFLHQLMWTDCVILLPILLIGLDKLMEEKKPLLYTATLAVMIIANFYIGFSICIFCCLYFAVHALQTLDWSNMKSHHTQLTSARKLGFSALRFSVFSLLGGAIAAVVVIPIGLAISQAISSEIAAPSELEWYGNISTILQHMLPEQPLSITFDGFNLSIGFAAFILVPLYFLNKNISIPERIANGCLLGFLGLSLVCNYLDYFWHGMHFPNQLPARWTFMFSLVLILLSCKGFLQLKGIKLPVILTGIGIGLVAALLGMFGYGVTKSTAIDWMHWVVFGLESAVLVIAVMLEWKSGSGKVTRKKDVPASEQKGWQKWAASACAGLMAVLMVLESGYSFTMLYRNTDGKNAVRESAPLYTAVMKEYTYGNAWKTDEEDFYRTEANGGFLYNSSLLGDYHGMTYYSSTMSGTKYNFLQYFGNRVYAKNVSSMYNITSPVQNSLFGIRYYLDFAKTLDSKVPFTTAAEESEECMVLENETVLALGYAVSEDVLGLLINDEVRAIANQNQLVDLLCGEEMNVFEQMKTNSFGYENLTIDSNDNWNYQFYRMKEGAEEASFHYTYICEKDGYIYLENNFRVGEMRVSWDGGGKTIQPGRVKFDALGYFHAGDVININVVLTAPDVGCCGLNLYYFNEDAWQRAYERLAEEQLEVDTFQNTYVKGNITVAEKSLVMTTIPQDGGWEVYCDGEKADTVTIADELIGVRVPAGSHTLEFRYHVPGLAAGAVISVLGILLTICLCCPKIRDPLAAKLMALKKK